MKDVFIQAGSLVLLSGLPGSGKSTLKSTAVGFRDLDQAWISADQIRLQLLGEVAALDEQGEVFYDIPQSANDKVWAIIHLMVKARLSHGRTCIVDATLLNDSERAPLADLAVEYGVPLKVLIVDTSLEDCLRANASRRHKVPEFRIREMFQPPAAPAVTTRQGKVIQPMPPQGFVMHSQYPFEVISRECRLVQQLPTLEGVHYDVIGDTHGLLNEVLVLLTKAGWQVEDGRLRHPQGRKLLFLGDVVDRGYASLELLRLIRQAVLDGVAECLPGNHEDKLVRFVKLAKSGGVERWGSFSNAETGMQMLKQTDCDELLRFLRTLPTYKTLQTPEGHRLAFVHGDVHRFDAELSTGSDLVFGQSAPRRGVDSDAIYEQGFERGLNQWILFRGHIPQTSEQEHVFSLERHPFQEGELVLLRLDKFLEEAKSGKSLRQSFNESILTHKCDYDFEEVSRKWDLAKGVASLVSRKLVSQQFDATKMLRVFKYSKETFWNNRWNESAWLSKARGLVLDVAGNIVSHPFDKCFNLHENGAGDDIEDDRPVIVVDKLNGFLGIVSSHPLIKGALLPHTQGSFEGPFVDYLKEFLDKPQTKGAVHKFLAHNDVTLMFEVLHPEDPHIIEYPADMMGLHLIGVRGKTQEAPPWTEEQVDNAAALMGLRRPKWERMTFGELKRRLKDARTEGFMVRADDSTQLTLLKAKSPYYLVSKFLGRMGAKKVLHMYGNPRDFKKTVDEEFYPLVDVLVASVPKDEFLAMNDEQRVPLVRGLIEKLL